jgi:hypothetical protein
MMMMMINTAVIIVAFVIIVIDVIRHQIESWKPWTFDGKYVPIILFVGEFIASHPTNYWEEGSIMEPSQKEIKEHDEPIANLLRELESIDMLHR